MEPNNPPDDLGSEDAAFEQWWNDHGQYCRAGGGEYEKTFAYRAWQASAKAHSPNLCTCATCKPNVFGVDVRMIVCSICGNKRCPHAKHHDNPCSGSNESGQKGSDWEDIPPPNAK